MKSAIAAAIHRLKNTSNNKSIQVNSLEFLNNYAKRLLAGIIEPVEEMKNKWLSSYTDYIEGPDKQVRCAALYEVLTIMAVSSH